MSEFGDVKHRMQYVSTLIHYCSLHVRMLFGEGYVYIYIYICICCYAGCSRTSTKLASPEHMPVLLLCWTTTYRKQASQRHAALSAETRRTHSSTLLWPHDRCNSFSRGLLVKVGLVRTSFQPDQHYIYIYIYMYVYIYIYIYIYLSHVMCNIRLIQCFLHV